ncbi:MAG TPA: NAD(P)H-hydrate epimerase, partial [Chloroflexota bacterium]
MKVVSAAEMRQLEAAAERLGLPGPALMEIAGRAFADAVARLYGPFRGQRVVVLCGPGNNGGDGLVAARWLAGAGARPLVLLVARRAGQDAKQMLLAEAGIPCLRVGEGGDAVSPAALPAAFAGAALIVDALLGIGTTRPIGGAIAETLAAAADSGAPIVALDLPSGLDADAGRADRSTPRCDATITLGAVKRGLVIREGPRLAGRLFPLPIGIPASCAADRPVDWLDAAAVGPLLPPREVSGHKGTFGRVLVIAGSAAYVGAPLLAALGAGRGGAGLVTLAAPGGAGQVAAARAPEITHLPLPGPPSHLTPDALARLAEAAEGRRAAVVGPGLGRHPETADLLRQLLVDRRLRGALAWIVDADALTLLSGMPDWSALLPPETVLTPHGGEM